MTVSRPNYCDKAERISKDNDINTSIDTSIDGLCIRFIELVYHCIREISTFTRNRLKIKCSSAAGKSIPTVQYSIMRAYRTEYCVAVLCRRGRG